MVAKRNLKGQISRRFAVCCAAAAGLLGAVPGALGVDMEQGEQAFNEVCSACHSVEIVFEGPRMTSQQWDYTVRDMVGRGASATDEQLELIRAYLKASWGSVWINRADAEELTAVLGMPSEVAEKVIAHRENNGDFENLESLKAVPGVDAAALEAQTGSIVFN